jgi:hypothetical protein
MKNPSVLSMMIRNKKKQKPQTDAGSEDDIQALTALEENEEPTQDDAVHANSYAYGGRVVDKRPGKDQGPEDSDLQDSEIERQNETTDAMDDNIPVKRTMGQQLSNASESSEEEDEQSNHENDRADRRDDEKELLRHVRKERAKKLISKL